MPHSSFQNLVTTASLFYAPPSVPISYHFGMVLGSIFTKNFYSAVNSSTKTYAPNRGPSRNPQEQANLSGFHGLGKKGRSPPATRESCPGRRLEWMLVEAKPFQDRFDLIPIVVHGRRLYDQAMVGLGLEGTA